MGAAEKLTQQQALEAITINAAHTIGIADITGSLRAGKRADFTVLDDDPLNCDPAGAARHWHMRDRVRGQGIPHSMSDSVASSR